MISGEDCTIEIHQQLIMRHVPEHLFARYLKIEGEGNVDRAPSMSTCPTCGDAIEIGGFVPAVRCPHNRGCRDFCSGCNQPPHDGRTCQQVADERRGHQAVSEVPLFSNINDQGRDAHVNGGRVTVVTEEEEIKCREKEVEWIGAFNDGNKKITSVEDKIGGRVLLSDGTAFENPVGIKMTTCPKCLNPCEAKTEESCDRVLASLHLTCSVL